LEIVIVLAPLRKHEPNPSYTKDRTLSAVDKFGNTLDFMLSETRDEAAATRFFARTIRNNGWPDRVVIDKSGANAAGLENMNLLLLSGWCWLIKVLQVKYLNNIIEQDHRFIKRITRQMKGFKSFASAQATLAGIDTAHMIRKGQLAGRGQSAFQQFKALAGYVCPENSRPQSSKKFATEPTKLVRVF
jgi:putative transposase